MNGCYVTLIVLNITEDELMDYGTCARIGET